MSLIYISMVLQGYFKGDLKDVTSNFQVCLGVSKLFQGWFKEFSKEFHAWFKGASKGFQGSDKSFMKIQSISERVLKIFHIFFRLLKGCSVYVWLHGVSRKFQECLVYSSRKFQWHFQATFKGTSRGWQG